MAYLWGWREPRQEEEPRRPRASRVSRFGAFVAGTGRAVLAAVLGAAHAREGGRGEPHRGHEHG